LNFYSQTLVANNKLSAAAPDSQKQTITIATVNTVSHESGSLSGSLIAAMPVIALAGVSKDLQLPAAPAASSAVSSAARTKAGSAQLEAAQRFIATAYALPGRTASGQTVRRGLIAADNSLPLGTRVRLDAGHYSGEYVVADRGGRVRGRIIDIWVPSNGEAIRFGRRPVKLTILSYGAKKAKRVRKTS